MAVHNFNNFYYLGRGEPEHRIGTTLEYMRDFSDREYWLVDFFSVDNLHRIEQYIPADILEQIKSGSTVLLMHNSHEAFHDIVDPIYSLIIQRLGIPPKQIMLLSESAIIGSVVKEVAQAYGMEEILVEWVRIFEYNVKICGMDCVNTFPMKTLQYKKYQKKFLNLNRRWRTHRPTLVALLEVMDLRNHGYISMAEHDDLGNNWNKFVDYARFFFGDSEIGQIIANNKDRILNIPNLYLDTKDLHINQAPLTSSTDVFYYNTYFSVVTETTFFKQFGEGVFLSEKIFKPVYKKHPFIVVSRPKTLEALRNIGYKSFSEIIDESYDLEENDEKRLLLIVQEINRLCNLSDDQLKDFLSKAEAICDYNYQVFMNKQTYTTIL